MESAQENSKPSLALAQHRGYEERFTKMSGSYPLVLFGIALITAIFTYCALENPVLFDRLLFRPDDILGRGEIYRMFTSALLHVDWGHYIFNFVTIYCFGINIEGVFGGLALLSIYVASVLGGSILSLLLHRGQNYSAVGASGGACGVLYASIFLFPGSGIQFFFIPITIPGSVYAVAFLIFSSMAMRRGNSNIGHDAHIGGAVVGVIAALILAPSIVLSHPILLLVVLSVSAGVSVFLIRGSILPTRSIKRRPERLQTDDEPLHRCVVCKRSDVSNPDLEFRVARDGNDYCTEHLPKSAAKP